MAPPALAVLLLLVLPAAGAPAAAPASAVDEFASQLRAYSDALSALPAPSAGCHDSYARIDARGPLTVSVFFGYIDTGRKGYVADADFKRALIGRLTEACRGTLQACGFAVAAGDPAAPNRTRLARSREGRTAIVDVYDSTSPSPDGQQALSRLAEEQYLAALKRDAVVLFAGHTRRFSGTGFYPPLSLSKGSAAIFLRRPFSARVNETLERSASSPAVLGLFACRTREYYAGRIHALAPGAALIVSSEASSHENSLMSLFGAVNMVLARPCFAEASRAVNPDGGRLFNVYGLFAESPHPRYTRYHDGRVVVIGLLLIPFLALLGSSRRPPPSWPSGIAGGAWSGAGLLLLLLIPSSVVARLVASQATAMPLLLTLVGWAAMALAAARGRVSRDRLAAAARWAAPFLLGFAALYVGSNLLRELSVDNALSALRQGAAFAAVFLLIGPFALYSEDALLAPFADGDGPGFIPSCLHTLVFALALWLSLCALAPVYKPHLWPVAALALCARTISFLLYRRRPSLLVPAVSLALSLALFITEGIHTQIYR